MSVQYGETGIEALTTIICFSATIIAVGIISVGIIYGVFK